eukprot:3341197-Amphidinium_carterae.1
MEQTWMPPETGRCQCRRLLTPAGKSHVSLCTCSHTAERKQGPPIVADPKCQLTAKSAQSQLTLH